MMKIILLKNSLSPLIFVVFIIAAGCTSNPFSSDQQQVTITVVDQVGNPVVGATISGGFDWTSFSVVTDDNGRATVPKGQRSTIFKTNYFPRIVQSFYQRTYSIKNTPSKVKFIGDIDTSLNTVAIVSEGGVYPYQGSYGDYYIINNKLFKLLSLYLIST